MSRNIMAAIAIAGLLLSWPAYKLYAEINKAKSENPLVWEPDIRALMENTSLTACT